MTAGSHGTRREADAAPDLDPLIHAPVRLRLCAALAATDEAEFGWLLDVLQISKSSLSKHATALGDAGYVEQRRAVRDTRQRVWLRLTDTGRAAYRSHVTALRAIVDRELPGPDEAPGAVPGEHDREAT